MSLSFHTQPPPCEHRMQEILLLAKNSVASSFRVPLSCHASIKRRPPLRLQELPLRLSFCAFCTKGWLRFSETTAFRKRADSGYRRQTGLVCKYL